MRGIATGRLVHHDANNNAWTIPKMNFGTGPFDRRGSCRLTATADAATPKWCDVELRSCALILLVCTEPDTVFVQNVQDVFHSWTWNHDKLCGVSQLHLVNFTDRSHTEGLGHSRDKKKRSLDVPPKQDVHAIPLA